jgi:hypothetical protein
MPGDMELQAAAHGNAKTALHFLRPAFEKRAMVSSRLLSNPPRFRQSLSVENNSESHEESHKRHVGLRSTLRLT